MHSAAQLALVDDHTLFRKGLRSLIELVDDRYVILFEADNGEDMKQKIDPANLPDVIMMDINMPGMNGFQSVEWLNEHHPTVRVLAISMIDKEESIVKMLKLGVKGYLSKDVEPKELGEALKAVINKGFYYTDFITGKLVHSLQHPIAETVQNENMKISDREREFLQFACSEMKYHEIAAKMYLSPKTIDGYRNSLFEKFQVKSRVGLALYAIKNGLVSL